MKQVLLFIAVVSFVGCSNTVTISDLFEREGCSGPCYKRMPCEGDAITVAIPLDGSNILENGNMVFVKDSEDPGKTIKVEFDESLDAEPLKTSIRENVGKTMVVKGHLEGYDLLTPSSCKRAHIIYVTNPADLSFQ